MLWAKPPIFTIVENVIPITGLLVGFSNSEVLSQWNGPLNTEGLHGMLKTSSLQDVGETFTCICCVYG